MSNTFASGKNSISECDRCGFRFRLTELRMEVVKTKTYQLLVCNTCWDPDQPQLQLGMYEVSDPQGIRNPRPDRTYDTSGLNSLGFPSGGSRDLQWGWNPVGGASQFDSVLTPNYLTTVTNVGIVTVTVT